MNTFDIMKIALDLVGFNEIPGDSAIYVPGDNIKKVLIGVDIESPELLLAKHLGVDCAISHHPKGGIAYTNYHEVFRKHKNLMIIHGVPADIAEELVEDIVIDQIVDHHRANHDHVPSFARLLKMPFMNIHNPCDELGRRIMADHINKSIKDTWVLQDVINSLMELKEFQESHTNIEIRMGESGNKAGKVAVVHGAATNGGANIAKAYFDHGVNTVIYIHIAPSELKKLKQIAPYGNLIISGHIASDAVGINPLIYALEERGVEVIRMSGM